MREEFLIRARELLLMSVYLYGYTWVVRPCSGLSRMVEWATVLSVGTVSEAKDGRVTRSTRYVGRSR